MKHTFFRAFVAAAFFLVCAGASAQYHPSTKWPYVFEQFTDGTVFQMRQNKTIEGKYNVCIDNGKLHYIDENGIILEAGLREISKVKIGARMFMNISGKLMEVAAESEDGVVLLERGAKAAQQGVDIGFGIVSDTYASSNVDISSITSLGSEFVQAKASEVLREREYGSPVDVEEKYQLRTAEGLLLLATKSDFQDYVGKKESKDFLKENKVKWNSPVTMLPVLKFLREMNK